MAVRQSVPPLEQAAYKAKADLAYESIRNAIMDGRFRPGDRLVTDAIASALNVSRMPVRDAIKRLQAEGVVDVFPSKGATVATVSVDHLKEVFAVRSVIEGLAAREAAKFITPDQISDLWKLFSEMEILVRSGAARAELAKNKEFHQTLYRLSENNLLQSMAEGLADSIDRYRLRFHRLPRRSEEVLEQHRAIIHAISSHDHEEAERLTREHIECTAKVIIAHFGDPTVDQDRQE